MMTQPLNGMGLQRFLLFFTTVYGLIDSGTRDRSGRSPDDETELCHAASRPVLAARRAPFSSATASPLTEASGRRP